MKKRRNTSQGATALRSAISVILLLISAVLLSLAATPGGNRIGLNGSERINDVKRSVDSPPSGAKTISGSTPLQVADDPDCYTWARVSPMPVSATYGGAATSDGVSAYVAGGFAEGIFGSGNPVNLFARYNPPTNTWTVLAPLPEVNEYASAVYSPINGKIYLFGGQNNSTVIGRTRIYDIASNSWSDGADMPAPRYAMASGYHNGKIYLIGGFDVYSATASPVTPGGMPTGDQSQVWEYDPIDNTWNASRLAMPEARGRVDFGVINGHLYVAGGRLGSSGGVRSLKVYDYDIANNTWTRRADMLNQALDVGCGVVDGLLRIFGGASSDGSGQVNDPRFDTWTSVPSFYGGWPATVAIGPTLFAAGGYRFNGMLGQIALNDTRTAACLNACDTNSWIYKASYPLAVESPAVGSDGAFAYCAGGLSGGVPINRFFRSDATANAWIPLPPLPAAVYSARGVYVPATNAFYVFGGRDSGNVRNTVYKYSFATGSWTNAAAMPAGRFYANVAYNKTNGKVYVIGGFDNNYVETKQTWQYDPMNDSWDTSRSDIPTPMAGSGTTSVGNFIYLIGSWNGGSGSTLHRRYDVTTNTWSNQVPLSSRPVYNPATVALGGRIYLIGGFPTGDRITFIYDIGTSTWDVHPSTNIVHGLTDAVALNGRVVIIGGDNGAGSAISTVEALAVVCSECPNRFSENFDALTPPALPDGWTATNAQGPAPFWTTTNTNAENLNNAYVTVSNQTSDKLLVTPQITLPPSSVQLRFRNAYHFSWSGGSYYNGGVLEISSPNLNGGAFTDIADPSVGASFVNGPYNYIVTDSTNPILGRRAWAADSIDYNFASFSPYLDTVVGLGSVVAGQPIQLRFRMGSGAGGLIAEWHIDNVMVKPGRCAPPLLSAVSRMVHGGAGTFDINLPATGTPGIECRTGPVAGGYQIVLTFGSSVSFSGASATSGNVTTSVSNNEVTVNLSGIANDQTVTVTLANADDGANVGDVSVSMKVLAGDTNASGSVNASDVSQTKAQVGQPVTISNFRTDVNANGSINASDVALVKSKSGTALP